jgi:hypothetical protein
MSKIAGFALVLAGLGVGIFGVAPSVEVAPQAATAQNPKTLKSEVMPAPRTSAAVAPRSLAAAVVIVAAPTIAPRIPQERFAIPKDRDALTSELQKELRRVGCYQGEINGTWSQSTRSAMKTFIEHMNARLPIENPDAVLYSLVKGQHEPVCGKACSPGDALNGHGRCVPSLLLAQAKSKHSSTSVATTAIERPALAVVGGSASAKTQSTDLSMTNAGWQKGAAQFTGRMGLAGPPSPHGGPLLGATTQAPRKRTTRTETIAAQPRLGRSAQHWPASVFSPRISNN